LIDDVYVSIDNKQELNELFEAMKMDILDTTTAESAEYRNIYRVELTVKPKKDSEVTTAEYKSTVILVETEQVASFISKSFNKNAKNVNSFINSRGYDKILKNSSDVISVSLHYNDKDDVVKTVKDSEKIDRIMAILYDTAEGNYTRYGENFSVEIKHGNGRSWLDVSKENGDSIIRIFEE
ncbi:MAG: hypothetical protein IJ272_06590, partial [Clostridia bacterium]|nr:hypothetical protein [Clostridia bacterium]